MPKNGFTTNVWFFGLFFKNPTPIIFPPPHSGIRSFPVQTIEDPPKSVDFPSAFDPRPESFVHTPHWLIQSAPWPQLRHLEVMIRGKLATANGSAEDLLARVSC